MSTDTRKILAELLANVAHMADGGVGLTDATALLEGGLGLDSLALLELVVGIEERLGVSVAPEDLGLTHFETFGRLVAMVESRKQP